MERLDDKEEYILQLYALRQVHNFVGIKWPYCPASKLDSINRYSRPCCVITAVIMVSSFTAPLGNCLAEVLLVGGEAVKGHATLYLRNVSLGRDVWHF